MKKFFIYLLGFIILIFILPVLLTKKTSLTSAKQIEQDKEQIQIEPIIQRRLQN